MDAWLQKKKQAPAKRFYSYVTALSRLFCFSASAGLIAATVIPLIRKKAWWIRVFDFPRLQITIAGTLASGALALLRKDRMSTITLPPLIAAVLYQAWKIYPYTPLSSKQVPVCQEHRIDRSLSIVAANVLQRNRSYDLFLNAVRRTNPDLILAAEADELWEAALRPLKRTHPYVAGCPLNNGYGLMLFSRLRLINPRVLFLVHPDVPSIHTIVEMESGVLVAVHGLHPKPPRPRTGSSTERDTEVFMIAQDIRRSLLPTIVMGDLNDVGWSRTSNMFRKISGLLDPRLGRGLYNTFDANSWIFRFPLDHVFHSRQFKVVYFRRLPYIGSDHFPIFIRLSI